MAKRKAPHEVNEAKPEPSKKVSAHTVLKSTARWILFGLLVCAVVYAFAYDLHKLLSLENLKAQQMALAQAYAIHPAKVIGLYVAICATFVVCCIPVASIMMISAGALFGLVAGTIICSCALSIGAVLSFLVSRFLLRDVIERKFKKQAAFVNHGIQREGLLFLATMRLLPMMPYFITNLLLGLTTMKLSRFWWVSQLASLPTIALHANAGTALASLTTMSDLWSVRVFASLLLLALFPLAARALVGAIRSVRARS